MERATSPGSANQRDLTALRNQRLLIIYMNGKWKQIIKLNTYI